MTSEIVESLFRQTVDPSQYEIIVVDNCSADNTVEVLQALAERAPCRMRVVPLKENRGPIYARNLAARMAEGEVLAFTDSDCLAHPEWLARGLAAFGRSPKVALVSGAVLDKPGQEVKFFSLRNGAGPTENYTYPTCNVMYRKNVFHEMGEFDESVWLFDVSSSPIECADTDFAWNVREAGYENVYLPDMIIYHEVTQVKVSVWLLYHTRMLVIPELVRRHPQLRGLLLLGGLFFAWDNIIYYLFLAGLVLGVAWNPWFALLAAPYLVWILSIRSKRLDLLTVPRMLARVPFLAARHFVICGSLIYGSMRSRTLVL
jgi:glycosyltransferase involved in cell wall biosynthesis